MNNICHILEFKNSTKAWEGINEMFITYDNKLFKYGSSYNSGMASVFNVFFKIKKAKVDPDFNFGRMFNYREQKWTTLVNNYLNLNELDLVRSKVLSFESKNSRNYNISYLFQNSHGNGKGCLLSATFSRRFDEKKPSITIVLRSSEITKRLIFDLLLIQRVGEYIYGNNHFSINVFATQMFCNTNTLIMYHSHKDINKLVKKGLNEWTDNVLVALKKFLGDPGQFGSYKVFLRTARCLRPDFFKFKEVCRPLIAKDLILEYDGIEYPEDCISLSKRKAYKKKHLKN